MRYKATRTHGAGSGIQVLARAANLLRICKHEPGGLSLGAIAERAGLPRSTVQRIVSALAAEGLLLADGSSGSIRLGPGIHALAEGAGFDVVEIAHPHLKRLSQETGETVDLAVLRRDHLVFVDQIAGGQRLRAVSAVGEHFPLHCTANGKAALALLEAHDVASICADGLQRFTPATLVTAGALRRDLRRVRATGIATDREEHSIGISAIGASFKDLAGAIYAISVPMPSVRFEQRQQEFGQALRRTIAVLSAEIGKPLRSG